jgi:ribonuclease BN (tRNA processing enzyme)|nr:MBL fold metallo-hydrolase [uncultured Acetatifactor sp.]
MCGIKTRDIPDYIQPYFDEASQFSCYREYEKSVKFRRSIEDKFICLRGFSSSTPMVNSAIWGRECLGGGFYFRYKGHGIAIDPGIGFTALMHRNNIFIDDIDTVIVTHSHIDHNCDVAAISALKHDYNSNKRRERRFFEEFFECNTDRKHNITWYMDEETIQSTQSILENDSVHALSEYCGENWAKISEGVALRTIKTEHVKGSEKTYGIKMYFSGESECYEWGYTSDTRFFEGLGDFFQGVSVLLFNISDIYPSDIEGRKSKQGHLGFDGSIKLLEKVKPKIALASEFCCTNGDYRYEIAKALREFSEVHVLPSDPGLTMDVEGTSIKCSLCGEDALAETVRIVRPAKEFGSIQYVCPNCLL